MNILIDDIKQFKEFTVRGCREVIYIINLNVFNLAMLIIKKCSFSNGGHQFAAVHGNVIQLYSTTTFENTLNLKGHNGKVIF